MDKQVDVSLQVTNTGLRSGDEVVQMYVKHVNSKVARPALELKGFQRVYVPAGQTIVVKLPLTAKSLMYWSSPQEKWSLENDKVEIMIGSSSQDIKLSKVLDVYSQVKK
jgi:beta-glucosidase